MSSQTLHLTERSYNYLLQHGIHETEIARQLRVDTHDSIFPHVMQISPEQGAFMALLVRLIRARKAIEIGTFTGYSALVVAEALPDEGKLITCDVSNECTQFAIPYWDRANVATKIELRIAPAEQTLSSLIDDGEAATFDFAFVDADKPNYPTYYEKLLTLLRPGGIIGIDNVLWGGSVADPENHELSTGAIRQLNDTVHQDQRVWSTMIPIGDGLTLAIKR